MHLLSPRNLKFIVILAFLFLEFVTMMGAEGEKDPHRPPCTSAACKKARRFVEAHYCGKPVGNGPDDSCEIRRPKKPSNVQVKARFNCDWPNGVRKCTQYGQPTAELRQALVDRLHKLGLPSNARGQIRFTVWKPSTPHLLLAEAYYDHIVGESVTLCQILAIVNYGSKLSPIKEVRFQKTDADKNTVTTWSFLDLADVDGRGELNLVLEGDAYEDHWVEVDRIDGESVEMIFSGLGYYL